MIKSKMKRVLSALSGLGVLIGALPLCPIAQVSAESTDFFPGDANCSGSVEISDVVLVLGYAASPGSVTLSGQGLDNADVYQRGDGVQTSDAASIQRYMLKAIAELPESYLDPVPEGTYIHLKNTYIDTEGENVSVDGTTATISASGEYYIDGTLDDGKIIVNVPDETVDADTVKIFLNGVNITGTSAPAIYVENAENTSINLMDDTENTLSDGTVAYSGDYFECGVIEAKDDITIKGAGSLNITANNQYAIQCNNDIKFTDGNVTIETLLEDAVRGKTSVTVKGTAIVDIDSEGDGIKSTKGNVSIEGGNVSIKAGNDAVQAGTTIDISGGCTIVGGDRGLTSASGTNITGGFVMATATDNQTDTSLLTATQGTMLLNCIDDPTQTDGCWRKDNSFSILSAEMNTDKNDIKLKKKYKYVLISSVSLAKETEYTLVNSTNGCKISHTNDTYVTFILTDIVTEFNTVNIAGISPDVPL